MLRADSGFEGERSSRLALRLAEDLHGFRQANSRTQLPENSEIDDHRDGPAGREPYPNLLVPGSGKPTRGGAHPG